MSEKAKRRTELDRAIDDVHKLRQRIADIFRRARTYHLPHAKVLEYRESEIFNYPRYKKLPRWAVSELSGYFTALHDRHWEELEYRCNWQGRLVMFDEVPDGRASEIKGGAHVYKDDPTKVYN